MALFLSINLTLLKRGDDKYDCSILILFNNTIENANITTQIKQ
jgi:hypothetical protein